jgi:hypothetical protein
MEDNVSLLHEVTLGGTGKEAGAGIGDNPCQSGREWGGAGGGMECRRKWNV